MRIQIVSHPALERERGAAQTALDLAAALRQRGHDAFAWSPEPLPPDTRWWNLHQRQRRAIERFAAAEGPFDVIDSPPVSATRRLARAGCLVVRDVQPELLYLRRELRSQLREPPLAAAGAARPGRRPPRRRPGGRLAAGAADPLPGQPRARLDGPRVSALGAQAAGLRHRPDRRRAGRPGRGAAAATPAAGAGRSPLLWIGRWAAHKGTAALLGLFAARAGSADRFTLAGCGPAAERELPAAWLRSGRVRVVPAFRRGELPALLAGHDAGLFTSDVEGWGICLNEMLESACPCSPPPPARWRTCAPTSPRRCAPSRRRSARLAPPGRGPGSQRLCRALQLGGDRQGL